MIARSNDAFSMLRGAIRSGLIKRKYLALVSGNLKTPLYLDAPIAHHPKNPSKMIVGDEESGRRAITRVEPIRRVGDFTLVAVTPSTGVRHQIRVHLANARFPIIGDELYGGPASDQLESARFWLHLSELEFESPASGAARVSAPLPHDLAQMI